ncbi:MAG: hypothetical protein GXP16_01755 [Gammaproteobacteria bacterium]|nr:hypothetical protein [Gammaproteobacteria bacterium]
MLRYDGTSSVPIFANGAGYAALTMAVGGSFRKTPRDTYSRNTVKLELEMTVGEPEASMSGVAQTTAEMRPQHVGPPELSTTRELPSHGTRSNGPNPNYVNHNSPSHGDQFGSFNIASTMRTPVGQAVNGAATVGGIIMMGPLGRVTGNLLGYAIRPAVSRINPNLAVAAALELSALGVEVHSAARFISGMSQIPSLSPAFVQPAAAIARPISSLVVP